MSDEADQSQQETSTRVEAMRAAAAQFEARRKEAQAPTPMPSATVEPPELIGAGGTTVTGHILESDLPSKSKSGADLDETTVLTLNAVGERKSLAVFSSGGLQDPPS